MCGELRWARGLVSFGGYERGEKGASCPVHLMVGPPPLNKVGWVIDGRCLPYLHKTIGFTNTHAYIFIHYNISIWAVHTLLH